MSFEVWFDDTKLINVLMGVSSKYSPWFWGKADGRPGCESAGGDGGQRW